MIATIECSMQQAIHEAALSGIVIMCSDVTAGEPDQCAGVVINGTIDWSKT